MTRSDASVAPASDDGLGALVRRSRLSTGMTIEELAEHSGVSVRAISDIERGVSLLPHRRSLLMLADAVGISDAGRAALLHARRAEWRRRCGSPGPAVVARGRVTPG